MKILILPPPISHCFAGAVFLLMVLVSNKLYAQTTFFTVYQPNQVTMTAAQSVRYNLLLNDTTISQLSIVSTADVRSFLANDTLVFQLPGQNTNVSAVAQRIEESTASGYTWSASLVNNLGYLSFIYQNNQTFGFIQIGQDFYELYPMNENYEFLVKKDLNYLQSRLILLLLQPMVLFVTHLV